MNKNNIKDMKNLISKISEEKTNGCTEVQVLMLQKTIDGLRNHLERNLLDPQLTSNIKTNKKDIPAINSLKKKRQQLNRLIKYLISCSKEAYNNFMKQIQEFGIKIEKHNR